MQRFSFLGNPESVLSDLLVLASQNIVDFVLFLKPVDLYKCIETNTSLVTSVLKEVL